MCMLTRPQIQTCQTQSLYSTTTMRHVTADLWHNRGTKSGEAHASVPQWFRRAALLGMTDMMTRRTCSYYGGGAPGRTGSSSCHNGGTRSICEVQNGTKILNCYEVISSSK